MVRSFRILLVDDFAPLRKRIRATLHDHVRMQVVDEASNGLEAVEKAHQLQPDLILLDIGLPFMNGIEAAHQIRELSPKSKILFLSEMRSRTFAEEALQSGGSGYIVKSDAASELLPGLEAVLHGGAFLSSSLLAQDAHQPGNTHTVREHEAGFYSDDRRLIEHVSQFLGTMLKAGAAVIVLATESHQNLLSCKLALMGIDVSADTHRGRYIAVDADQALSQVMVNGLPDPDRFESAFSGLLAQASEAGHAPRQRVGVFGECVHLLCARGNPEAAIQMEKLGNKLLRKHDLHILCGYSLQGLHDKVDVATFHRIRDEHSLVHFH